MQDYWEDRLTSEQHKKMSAAMKKFRSGKKTRNKQDELYELLTNMGVHDEEASEILNLEMED